MGVMYDYFSFELLMQEIQTWMFTNLFTISSLFQLSLSVATLFLAKLISRKPKKDFQEYIYLRWDKTKLDKHNEEAIISLVFPVIALILQWCLYLVSDVLQLDNYILEVIAKLLTAWIIIRLISGLVKYPSISKIFAFIAWTIAALSILDLLNETIEVLDGPALNLGENRISILSVMKGVISLIILLWVAGLLSKIIDSRIRAIPNVTPSVRVLLTKFSKIILIAIALLIGVQSLGLDLTTLNVFGGAIGLGLGFGLQKVVSNLVCGVILLLDRSVKPGDVIQVNDTYGEVNALGARYVSVLTRDGVEHLIPNENLITGNVTNWSYSSKNVRLKFPIGISYDSDVRVAMEILEQAALDESRVLRDPAPVSRLVAFADNSIDLELRIWIRDPEQGVVNVRSAILLKIWDKFKENNISIPYPQREVKVIPSEEMELFFEKLNNAAKK